MVDPGDVLTGYKRRLRRKRLLWRAFKKRGELERVSFKAGAIQPKDVLLFATLRNEAHRLSWFLDHYRRVGVDHFLMVDNDSSDNTIAYLAAQTDVSVWQTSASYKDARFGMDWLTALQWRYGSGHWILTVDADELFIYPEWDKRDLKDLTTWLADSGGEAMGALMLDMYPKGALEDQDYVPGQDPLEVLQWFDAYGYWVQRQNPLDNLWLQGGPRARCFFANDPDLAPTLNKTPLVFWKRGYVYVNSTHSALPVSLNRPRCAGPVKYPTGALLHTKFLPGAAAHARLEKARGEHFATSQAYHAYYDAVAANPVLWDSQSCRYEDWCQLVSLGLMQGGDWLSDPAE